MNIVFIVRFYYKKFGVVIVDDEFWFIVLFFVYEGIKSIVVFWWDYILIFGMF